MLDWTEIWDIWNRHLKAIVITEAFLLCSRPHHPAARGQSHKSPKQQCFIGGTFQGEIHLAIQMMLKQRGTHVPIIITFCWTP